MPKAGSTQIITMKVTEADGVTPVTGLGNADFSFPATLAGAIYNLDFGDVTDLSDGHDFDGFYSIPISMPTTVGTRLRVDIVTSIPTRLVDPDVVEGDLTANDLDDVAVLAARPPSVTLAGNVSPQSAFTMTVYKGDGRTIQVPIYDDNGDLINLTLWENFRFSIKNANQTVVGGQLPYDLAAGITGSSGGLLSIPIPEDCSAYAAHAAGHKKTTLYWSVDANLISTGNTKTRTLRAGPFIILSKETPSP